MLCPSTPNERYFAHVDWIVEKAIERGITPFVVPTWSRFITQGYAGPPVLFDCESARSYGAFLGDRYPYLPKILGGDSNPIWTDPSKLHQQFGAILSGTSSGAPEELPRYYTYDIIDAMAEGILSTETDLKPFLTYHPAALWLHGSPIATSSGFFGDRSWLVLDGCQSGHADLEWGGDLPFESWKAMSSHIPITAMWTSTPTRPVIDLESHCMHNGLIASNPKIWDGDDIRSGAWQSVRAVTLELLADLQVLSGACGVVYASNASWQMYDPDRAKRDSAASMVPACGLDSDESWRKALSLPGPHYLAVISKFFLALDNDVFHHLRPTQTLLIESSAPVEAEHKDGRVDVMCDMTDDHPASILIAHTGSGYSFKLDLAAVFKGRKVKAQWVDPRSGSIGSPWDVASDRVVSFVSATQGSVKEDWVLVVQE